MKLLNAFAVLIFGVLAMGLVPDFMGDSAATKADVNCDSSCDSKIGLAETVFLLTIPLGIAVKAGLVPPPRTWVDS